MMALVVCSLGMLASLLYADEKPLQQATLKQCYALALKRSETLAISYETIDEAKARFRQAFSTILPEVYFQDSEKRRDTSGDGTSTKKHVANRAFVLSQPLFSGFKEFAAMNAAKAEQQQLTHIYQRARQLLLIDMADAFYLLKSYQEDVRVLQSIHKTLADRMVELKRREELGRTRSSDVVSTEAQMYKIQAAQTLAESQYELTRQLMTFLTGVSVESLAEESLNLAELDDAYVQAMYPRIDVREDVLAAQQGLMIAKNTVSGAKSGYYPEVSVDGHYYLERGGSLDTGDWDAILNIKVPLFDGLYTKSLVEEAAAELRMAELLVGRTKREAYFDAENAITSYRLYRKQADALQKAVEAAQKSYDFSVNDYKNNLINNLDVLQSLENLLTLRRDYISAQSLAQRAYWNFRVAIGDVNDDAL